MKRGKGENGGGREETEIIVVGGIGWKKSKGSGRESESGWERSGGIGMIRKERRE